MKFTSRGLGKIMTVNLSIIYMYRTTFFLIPVAARALHLHVTALKLELAININTVCFSKK